MITKAQASDDLGHVVGGDLQEMHIVEKWKKDETGMEGNKVTEGHIFKNQNVRIL